MVSKADNDALEAQFESQFQKPGDLVERDDAVSYTHLTLPTICSV